MSSSSALPFSPLPISLSVEPTNQVVTIDKLQTRRTRTGGTATVDNRRRRRRRIQQSESVLPLITVPLSFSDSLFVGFRH